MLHVYPDDQSTFSTYCDTEKVIQWAAAPSMTTSVQLALRVGDSHQRGTMPYHFEWTDLRMEDDEDEIIARGNISLRQVGLVYARQGDRYTNERAGAAWVPDILAPIHKGTCGNGSSPGATGECSTYTQVLKQGWRFAFDSGGRTIATIVAEEPQDCERACSMHDACKGFTMVTGVGSTQCHLVNQTSVVVTTWWPRGVGRVCRRLS